MIGAFFNSEDDMTDTLYISFNGYDFYQLGEPYIDKYPNSRGAYEIAANHEEQNTTYTGEKDVSSKEPRCLHDPSIMYASEYFFMLSGYVGRNDESQNYSAQNNNNRFKPMWGYSKDLVTWSYPSTGTYNNVDFSETEAYNACGAGEFDCVAPDFFFDPTENANNDKVSAWIVVSAGYFATWHGDKSLNDRMSPYLIQMTTDMTKIRNNSDVMVENTTSYGKPKKINLPGSDENENRIDGTLYKENGKYYLIIKRDCFINEIWSIDKLSDVDNEDAWTLVNSDFLDGYEGPGVTKFNNSYYVYADKISQVDQVEGDGYTGIYVTVSSSMDGAWKKEEKVRLYGADGTEEHMKNGRHGSVMTVKRGDTAYEKIKSMYADNQSIVKENVKLTSEVDLQNGILKKDGEYYLYEKGHILKCKETYDQKTDAWYYFDEEGKMVRDQSVFLSDGAGGKWVYYDSNGHMVKGEYYQNGFWYYYDMETGKRATGFVYLKNGDKWVYYDNNGHMQYGEQYINGNWYRFDDVTGKMVHGEYISPEGNKYYYDDTTGIMYHGWKTMTDGSRRYYDDVTGILQE